MPQVGTIPASTKNRVRLSRRIGALSRVSAGALRHIAISFTIIFTLALIEAAVLNAAGPPAPPGDIRLDDKIESLKKAGVGPVIFPHLKHEKLYKCGDCHPKIFKDKHGENDITMKKNMDGQFCGSCHNALKAFALYNCKKCHTNVRAAR